MQSPDNGLILMIPGPTWIRDDVRNAGAMAEFGHRDQTAKEIISNIFANLTVVADLPDDYEPVLINGSGTSGMESALKSVTAPGDHVLCISVGVFGDLFHTLAKTCTPHVTLLKSDHGKSIDLDMLESVMSRHQFQVVTITHNESSTGVTTDIVQACNIIKKHGALPLIDGVSIFGGAPSHLKEARPSIYVTATQKCLALPAGFAIAFVGPDAQQAFARAGTHRGYCTDLELHLRFARECQTLTTPSTTLLNQMHLQLEYIVGIEGVATRHERHRRLQSKVRRWGSSRNDLELFVSESDASPALTTLSVIDNIDTKRLKSLMRSANYLIDTGHATLNRQLKEQDRPSLIRVPHMGDLTDFMIDEFLKKLGAALDESRQ